MFRARIRSAFALPGRGTFLGVEILSVEIKIGDPINVPLTNGRCVEVEVRAVEFIDQLPEKLAEVGLGVTAAIRAGEVAVDEIVTGSSLGRRTVQSVVEALIERSVTDPNEPEERKRLMRLHGALLAYESWTGYLFLRPDGSAFYIDDEEPGAKALSDITDAKQNILALVLDSSRWPELRALLPVRDDAAPDCPACQGTGMQKYGPHEIFCAHCGALGSLPGSRE